jgi:hypothetical protein
MKLLIIVKEDGCQLYVALHQENATFSLQRTLLTALTNITFQIRFSLNKYWNTNNFWSGYIKQRNFKKNLTELLTLKNRLKQKKYWIDNKLCKKVDLNNLYQKLVPQSKSSKDSWKKRLSRIFPFCHYAFQKSNHKNRSSLFRIVRRKSKLQ